jgi:DNA-binding GntR family transcriptional regulator
MSTDWALHDSAVTRSFGDSLSAVRRIRHVLIAAITAGDIAPGTRLKEAELGQQLGVSRTPLREALAALRAEGILSIGEDSGLCVRALDYQDVHALYQMRATLEGMAAELAAAQASLAERSFIAAVRAEEASLVTSGATPSVLAEINGRFHHAILLASHNPFLIETMQRLGTLMVLLGPTAYSLASRVDEIGSEHDTINAAIQAARPEDAGRAARTHLQNAVRARLEIMATGQKGHID